MKNLFFVLIASVVLFSSCAITSPNQYVIYTHDCWKTKQLAEPGDVMPRLTSFCDKRVVLPAYSMPGSSEFFVRFKNDVRASITVDYLYSITKPLVFVDNAKFILSSNETEENPHESNNALEMAENTVLDKKIKDFIVEALEDSLITTFSESSFEDQFVKNINSSLSKVGIELETVSIVVKFGTATEKAIDVVSAMKLFEGAGLKVEGAEILEAEAGKPVINITLPNSSEKEE